MMNKEYTEEMIKEAQERVKQGQKSRASFHIALVLGVLFTVILEWIPIIGPLMAGIFIGVMAGGRIKGFLAALFSGIIGLVLFSFILSALGTSIYIVLNNSFGISGKTFILYLYIVNVIIGAVSGFITSGSIYNRINNQLV